MFTVYIILSQNIIVNNTIDTWVYKFKRILVDRHFQCVKKEFDLKKIVNIIIKRETR